MPVWHKQAKSWVEQGRLAMVGVIQEQHPERCRLFAQWQQFDWPIVHDPINVLKAKAVPILVAIDEHGIVRSTKPKVDDFASAFLDRHFDSAPETEATAVAPLTPSRESEALARQAEATQAGADWRSLGDSLAIWHRADRLDDAIAAYENALRKEPSDLDSRFRLGVCLRMRYETAARQTGDFGRAVAAWEEALAGDPNQYIWRRRIQQYGPRLIKPYPFYDWVTAAETDIRGRGETPIPLAVRPSGAEIAAFSRSFTVSDSKAQSPDPNGAILRDTEPLIRSTVTTVPSQAAPGSTARVHVSFVPNEALRAHWNNEAEPLRLWIDPPAGGQVAQHLLQTVPVAQPVSDEVRRIDFEVQLSDEATGTFRLSTYALYYVCEDADGLCRFLRQDIPIEIPVATVDR